MLVEAPDHLQRVASACTALLEGGVLTFAALLDGLDGADPTVVVRALDEVAATRCPVSAAARRLSAQARSSSCSEPPTALPVPHPLDYAWRFDRHTASGLVTKAAAATVPGDTILFLGTPSVHALAIDRLPDRELVLIDRDHRQLDACERRRPGSTLTLDLLTERVPALGARLCIADPPWYPAHVAAFAHAAATALIPSGVLLLAFPSVMTRPGLHEEHVRLREEAQYDGLTVIRRHRRACRYETPPFERSAMSAAGLPCPPRAWRVGELVELQRGHGEVASRTFDAGEPWVEFELEQIPLRVRPTAPPTGTRLIERIVDGDVLSTVSSRAPAREHAALWTSRNRVFASCDPPRLLRELSAVEARGRIEGPFAERVQRLVQRERIEHGLDDRASRDG